MKRGTWTRAQQKARYAKGYGRGEFGGYRPWLEPKDVPSLGASSRVPGETNGRQHAFLSGLELSTYLICRRLPGVIDLREQYPLWPLEETEEISTSMGIRHPAPRNCDPQVMTVDLLITMQDGSFVAKAVKPREKLEEVRTLEKLSIEKACCEARGIPWSLVTENELPPIVVRNLLAIAPWREIPVHMMSADVVADAEARLGELVRSRPDAAFGRHCEEVDGLLGLTPGSSFDVAKHALANRRWEARLDLPISDECPLVLLHAHARVSDDESPGTIGVPAPPCPRPGTGASRGASA